MSKTEIRHRDGRRVTAVNRLEHATTPAGCSRRSRGTPAVTASGG